ncbi:AER391Cp [Eremothecium gossypii ATCC 10895]|uniref:RING-type E3 ubiquitin transferase n=1 Tax=Eremothecium gossypii (strain ATCC 10895 / CBS 109.51 / FGSC 9923 / NRRL Y-1056) TaxID=284811 RepID=Q755X7_EREGS|nr:AER391Cp [Eremothecium gossypii ATCC 10895]AAS53070.1 AER391Cp [Eremothecium gossypii ATCC 10895]AEY97378.1 FAER391Cp [Eremothecium gossypii FDAG1]
MSQTSRNFRRTQGRKPQTAQTQADSADWNGSGRWRKSSGYASGGGSSAGPPHSPCGDTEEDNGEMTCLICADTLRYVALSPCNHTTCHKCAFRQRALYEKKACLVCRTEHEYLIFTDQIKAEHARFGPRDIVAVDDRYGIQFTSLNAESVTLSLLKYNCPYGDVPEFDLDSFKNYNEHLKNEHKRSICTICARHRKQFPAEMKTLTPNQLKIHNTIGDSKGFTGHPLCGFCSGKRFYSDDELYIHMRERHEKCHICDQVDSTQPQYFKDYDQLFEHFKHSHYICAVRSCLDSKFVVFADDLDLQAHMLKEHPNIMGNKSTISLTAGRRYRSELSSGFTPNVSRAVHETSSSNALALGPSVSPVATAESPEMKRKRLEERARHYLNYSQSEMKLFEQINNDYNNNVISATSVQRRYDQLFRNPEADTHLLLRNFADTFPEGSLKYKELNAIYQAEQEKRERQAKFPSLSTNPWYSAPVVGAAWGKNGGKSSSSRNFPSLSSALTDSYQNVTPQPKKPVPYRPTSPVASSSTQVQNTKRNSNYTPTYLKSKTKGESRAQSNAALFPPLSSPDTKKFRAPPVNELPDPKQWGKSKREPSRSAEALDMSPIESALPTSGKSKGKQKQKQLLFHVGL